MKIMELEEMKNTWNELSKRVEKQELQTDQIIEKMTQQKYHSKLNKISYSEYAGTIICYIGAAYLIVNFAKIEETLMQIFTIIAILLLFILPVISLKSVRIMKNVEISSKTYLEAINHFGKQKIRFQKLQKLNVSLGLFLLLISVPVLSAIQGKNISETPYFWTLIFPFSILFFLVFAYWVMKSYNKVLNATEEMLSEINQ
ncbi:hypothetical protein OOZ15_15370 [Galbibacter sp. EGI 63066]|uniref:hypothetical protein n=1 Tax=Galbibacter sp. EGI 63066 TaxID=2993559 RepID=UPI002248B15C|nr:hypothetical protein [Galbibacter sp. EGI 63066]MCX2681332.1 hypothetical protein [Galbibacter sp. EGI 63066]